MTTLENPKFDAFMDDLRARLRVQYESSNELRAEFPTADIYVAFELNSATARPLVRGWKAGFDAEAAERAIVAVEVKSNTRKAEARRAAGRLRVARC